MKPGISGTNIRHKCQRHPCSWEDYARLHRGTSFLSPYLVNIGPKDDTQGPEAIPEPEESCVDLHKHTYQYLKVCVGYTAESCLVIASADHSCIIISSLKWTTHDSDLGSLNLPDQGCWKGLPQALELLVQAYAIGPAKAIIQRPID